MNKEELKKQKEKLEENRDKLREMLERFANEDKKPEGDWDTRFPKFDGEGDLEESADEVEEYSSLLPVEHSLEVKLKNIEEALERIKKDTYGKCQKCKKEIDKRRLKALPEAKTCISCK